MSSVTQEHGTGESPPAPPVEMYPYGWREVFTRRPDGTLDTIQIPLTLEDALHPEFGDFMAESVLHVLIRDYLAEVCRARTYDDPMALVLSDVLIYWDVPDIKQHGPDVAVVFGVRNRDADRSSFHVAEEGARPRVIIEIVSPSTRENDVEKKVEQYHRVRVPYYIILDRVKEDDPWQLRGYRYEAAGYVPMDKDGHGRLWLEDIGVWLGTDGQQVICYDGVTDAPIGDYLELTRGLHAAQENIAAEAARAEVEKARAEAEKARAEAEKARADAAKAHADAEAEGRKQAETRLRELERELERLRGQPPAT